MASYVVIYSKSDEKEVLDLTQGINNVTLKSFDQNQNQVDEPTKSLIIDCNFFVCCLSKNSSQLLLDIAKFARCIARKEIYMHFIGPQRILNNEDQSFLEQTISIENIAQIKVKIFLNSFVNF